MTAPKFLGLLTQLLLLTALAQAQITLTTSQNPSTFGAPVTLTATVAPSNATGRVTFYDGVTVLGTKPLSAGTASLSTILLQAGTRKLTAYYSGDATNVASTGNFTQTVNAVTAVGFRAEGLLSIPAFPLGVAVGDLNGDGKADLVIPGNLNTFTPFIQGTVTILLGNGDGTFQTPASYAVGSRPSSAAIADFNGDGNPDIAVSSLDTQNNGILSILLGNGDGTFRSPVNSPAASGPMAVADFNGDGKPDLVILSTQNSMLNVFIGNGDGTFRAPVTSAGQQFFFGQFSALVVGDFNGDGKPDVAAVAGGAVNIALGNGDGTFHFAAPLSIVNVFGSFSSLAVGDFNSDGKTDLVVGDSTNNSNSAQWVFLGKGDGTFQTPVGYPISGTVTAADFNGDGITDLAIAGSSGTSIKILQGSGDGTFHLVLNYTTVAGPFALAVADFNGDGRADIVAANSSDPFLGGILTILLGTTAGVSLNATGGTPQSALSGATFNVPLQVTVVRDGSPVNGAIVTFTAPSSGPSAVLSPPATAITNVGGIASVIATANGIAGSYVVTATYQGLTASFTLTNTTVASIVASGGSPQSALVNTPFPKPLEVTVRDSAGNLASGATITFTAPTNGASASLPGTAVTNAAGQAIVQAFASNIPGSYTVTARVGTLSAAFSLTNTQIASVTTAGGTPQFTPVGTAFPNALQVTVKDSAGRPANNVFVSFAVPSSGASAVLSNFASFTNLAGVASVMATANNILGSYTVTASLPNSNTTLSASFSLTNLAAGTVAPVNLALGRTATQSSTLSGYPTAGPASALDGSTDGNFFHGSVTHTNLETNPWWQVDLGASASINSIVIWNRTDCCSNRLTDYWVFTSETPFSPTDTLATLQNRTGIFSSHQTGAPNPSTSIPTTSINAGVLGRYVRVQLTGTDALSLAEVQVLGVPRSSSVNLALGKPAAQSSNLNSASGASRAVDGNTDGNYFHGSVTHTNQEVYPWWQVDLGNSATIDSIVIWNRTDCCGNRLSNYWVFVSNTPFGGDNPYSLANRPGTFSIVVSGNANSPTTTIPVGGFQGQFVRVQLQDSNPLSLAEVQVFGTPGGPPLLNLALGKPAAQSSTISGYATAAAGSAVDGNVDGNFFNGSVTHTNLDINPWWQVDLGASAAISTIVVWNRTDPCCTGRLTNFWVFVSDTPFSPTDTPATLQGRAGTFSSQQFGPPSPSTSFVITGAQGRYVRVQIAGANNLSLAEVQVYGTPLNLSGSNLAQGKPASQSSTLSGYATTGAGFAVDGNTDGNFFNGSVTHTNLEANAWWQVDLGASSAIASIAIWNRTDCCSARLNDYWVFVSDTPFSPTDTPATLQGRAGTFSSHQTATPSPSTTIAAVTQGRYVRVQLSGSNNLSLAEVQVIGQ